MVMYNVASHGSVKGFELLWGRVPPPSKNKLPIETPPLKICKVFFLRGSNIFFGGEDFLGTISFRRMVVHSPKIVINLSWTYEKLPCKGEPYRFSGYQDPLVQTNILLLYYKDLPIHLKIPR